MTDREQALKWLLETHGGRPTSHVASNADIERYRAIRTIIKLLEEK